VSYILDALRKSDQQRRRNAAPTLLLGPAAAEPPKQPALFAYGLLALVLLGAGVAIGWLRPWQSEPTSQMPLATTARLPEPRQIPAPQAVPAPEPGPELQAQHVAPAATGPAAAAAVGPVPAPVPAPAIAAIEPTHTPPKVVKKAAAPVPVAAASGSSPPGAAAPAAAVMTMAELPLAIQQELPPMSISVHAYSGKAADRLVGINGRLLHEGDSVAPGLALEQITPDGMILSYKGYTFRHGVR
jgi:general secretion pathway protein B